MKLNTHIKLNTVHLARVLDARRAMYDRIAATLVAQQQPQPTKA